MSSQQHLHAALRGLLETAYLRGFAEALGYELVELSPIERVAILERVDRHLQIDLAFCDELIAQAVSLPQESETEPLPTRELHLDTEPPEPGAA
jgi:hypothetical protein